MLRNLIADYSTQVFVAGQASPAYNLSMAKKKPAWRTIKLVIASIVRDAIAVLSFGSPKGGDGTRQDKF